jgi:hypothetical protein
MSKPVRRLAALTLILTLVGCTLPGSASPTPFSFPTPDLTLTALVAPTVTRAPSATPLLAAAASPTPPASATAFIPGTGTPEGEEENPLTPTLPAQDARANGRPVYAEHFTTAPTLDGIISEWQSTPTTIEANVFGVANWSGIADSYGHFHVGWDDQALYLAVVVIDDAFVQVSSGRNMFRGDIVELQLDTDLRGDFASTVLSGDDYQMGLSPGNFGSIGSGAYRWYPYSLAGIPAGVTLKAVRTDDGYDLEARLPWSALGGVTPAEGDSFGFALSISDNDLAGTAVQQSMVSTVSTRKLTNPTTWGTLVLGP